MSFFKKIFNRKTTVYGLYAAACFAPAVAYEAQPAHRSEITVTDKVRAYQGGGVTDTIRTTNGTFAIYRVDMPFHAASLRDAFHLNNRYNQLKTGCTYEIKSYGFHFTPFMKPHILQAQHIPTAACPKNG